MNARQKLATRDLLAKTFPQTFAPKGSPKKPLKVGISKDVVERLTAHSKHRIFMAIADYCTGPSYFASCTPNAPRFDLDGNPCGTVTAEQAEHASEQLATFPKEIRSKWSQSIDASKPQEQPEIRKIDLVGCVGKIPFETVALAHKVNRRRDNGNRVYKCKSCRMWHLGTPP